MNRKSKLLLIIGIIIVTAYISPFLWMILTSFKGQQEIFQTPPTFLPNQWLLDGYRAVLDDGILINLRNSFIIGIGAAVLAVVLSVPCAYGLVKQNVKFKAFFIFMFLGSQLLPATVLLTPLFLMFNSINILDSLWAPIIATSLAGIPFSVLMLRPFFAGIPKSLEEAASIDGATKMQTFTKIILPISSPSIAVCGAISFFFAWGDLIYSITFNRNQNLWPMTAGIHNAIGRFGIQWNNLMAFATISSLPIIIIFILLQKQIVAGLTGGAVK